MVSELGSTPTSPNNSPSAAVRHSSPQRNMDGENNQSSLTVNNSMKDLTIVTFPATLKLTATNYLGWKTQIEALLYGLDLHKYVDGTCLPPPLPESSSEPNSSPSKEYNQWFRQDRLLFGALVGSLSPQIVPLITNATSSYEAWKILATTYASPSRGHIKQLQHRLKQLSKTPTQSITDYMQNIKTVVDELAILGKKMDQEDIIDVILNGLDQTAYKPILDSVLARDNPISFNELHEKLINHELSLAQQVVNSGIHQPASVFYVQNRNGGRAWNGNRQNNANNTNWNNNSRQSAAGNNAAGLLPSPSAPSTTPAGTSRPFLGKCQWCHQKGHSLGNCTVFKRVNPSITVPSYTRNTQVNSQEQKPQVFMAHGTPNASSNWLFDSGASHHITNDLNNLSLHAPYDGTEELVIGDGSEFQSPAVPGIGNQGNI